MPPDEVVSDVVASALVVASVVVSDDARPSYGPGSDALVGGSEEGESGSEDKEADGYGTSDDDEDDESEEEDDDGDDEDWGLRDDDFGDDDMLKAGDGFAGRYVFSSRRPSVSPRWRPTHSSRWGS